MIERLDGQEITLDDCEAVSRRSSVLLAVDDPIPEAYVLEVSSPGVDRPLVKPRDFVRFVNHAIKIQLLEPVQDRKRMIGQLTHADDENITLALFEDGQDVLTCSIPYTIIQKAKLFIDFEQSLSKKGKKSGRAKS